MAEAPKKNPIALLTLARLRESVREPGILFWVIAFPVFLSLGLGLAFRNPGPPTTTVGVLAGPGASPLVSTLSKAGVEASELQPETARERLRSGQIAMVITASSASAPDLVYRYDPARNESLMARAAVDQALQKASGRKDVLTAKDELVTEPGSRYIDFLIPGLIGMNLMSGSMWGIGWHIANLRVRKLLKRMLATPMKRRDLLIAQGLARLVWAPLEVATVAIVAWLAFDFRIHGSIGAISLISLLGAASFAAIAVLVASRGQNAETVSGWMNAVMVPMFMLSGVFFSSSHYPDLIQPIINAMPLTALNDALRAVMLQGAGLVDVVPQLIVLGVWGLVSFAVGLKIFRWS